MKFQEAKAINAKLKNGGIILLLVQLIKAQITVKFCIYVRCVANIERWTTYPSFSCWKRCDRQFTGNCSGYSFTFYLLHFRNWISRSQHSVHVSVCVCVYNIVQPTYTIDKVQSRFYCFSSYLFLIARMLFAHCWPLIKWPI